MHATYPQSAVLTWFPSMDVVVQPSVPWMSLNDQIKDSGLFFPVDPGPSVRNILLQLAPNRLPVAPMQPLEDLLTDVSGSDWRHGGYKLQVRQGVGRRQYPQLIAIVGPMP